MFRASGIKSYHMGDEEPQVIFWGKMATDIIPLVQDDGWVVTHHSKDRVLFRDENLRVVVNWVTQHFNQYRKALVKS
jgi:hypothetical protein